MSLFGALNVGNSGMSANQVAMETSGNNIANANTPGYSRQQVSMTEQPAFYEPGIGSVGTGVDVTGIHRVVDDFVRTQARDANSKYQYYQEKSDKLGQLQDILNEPSSNGIVKQLSTLTTAWNTLADDPELGTAKSSVVEDASSFADTVKEMAGNISDLGDNITSTLAKNALDFNSDVKQLQTLNQQIYNLTSVGQTPNDLLDQRDATLKNLSTIADVTTSVDNYGRVSLKLGDQTILNGDTRNTLSVVTANVDGTATIAKDGDTVDGQQQVSSNYPANTILLTQTGDDDQVNYSQVTIDSGTVGGLETAAGEVTQRLQELNNFATTIAKTINMVYTNGQSSTSGFFEIGNDASSYASKMTVNAALAADPDKLTAGASGASGDNSVATAIVNLSTQKFDYPVTDSQLNSYNKTTMAFETSASGKTYSDAFNNIVTKNAISKQQADNLATAQNSVLSQLNNQDQTVSGVSVNEEITNVIAYQRGFEANARVISVISDMLDTLINKTGV
ncbi:flagellar hook-associated protein FlgK [Liquorilactobacillus nagelii]|uniref:flagellar hook-associated protein FlgK n=1 Tax=Liquorilactobacillus nagelii TaxID=82688 RepID=UPI0039EA8E2F